MRDDEGGIRIADIERGADGRVGGVGLEESEVILGNGPVLSEPTLGHPAADA